VIAQAVNLMNFLKGPTQFIIPICPSDVYICAMRYAQTFEMSVDNGGAVSFMRGRIDLTEKCVIQETRPYPQCHYWLPESLSQGVCSE
jgi:hypothetical protein